MQFSKIRHMVCAIVITAASFAQAKSFTIIVFPDLQNEMIQSHTYENMQVWPATVNWIVDNKASENIKFVCDVGDFVNWETPYSDPPNFQYKAASDGMAELDAAGIPYCIAVGNHDTRAVGGVNPDGSACWCSGGAGPGNVRENLRNTETLNAFFPPERYRACEGRFENDRTDNAYHTFSAGGLDWLVINTELDPRQDALDWFNSVITAHPHHNVIYVTHNYLSGAGTTNGGCGYGNRTPQQVWDGCLKQHPNIKLVFSGHTGGDARRINTGANGNSVYEILSCWHDGKGWFRYLEIDPDAGTITAKTYSPHLGQFKTGNNNAFTLTGVSFVPPAATSLVSAARADTPLSRIALSANSVVHLHALNGRLIHSMPVGGATSVLDNNAFSAMGIQPGNWIYRITDASGNNTVGKLSIPQIAH